MAKPDKKLQSDILVIGGGLAGCLAAIRAKELLGEKGTVIMVDKSYAGRSGQSTFAAGILTAFDPDLDDLSEWLGELITFGEYLNDQEWCRKLLTEGMEAVRLIDGWAGETGIKVFHKNEDGSFYRRQSRGHYKTKHLVIQALPLMEMLRKKAVRAGVRVVDRVMITDLVMEDGVPKGALGLAYREKLIYFFPAKAIIVAASGSGFKATFLGHQSLTGDLQAAAFRAGVVMRNMEQYAANTTSRHFDIHGLNLFVSVGGKFINRLGEDFMPAYNPTLGSRARLQDLVLAFCREAAEGRGPVYLDMRKASERDRTLCREVLPETFLLWDRAGIDPFAEPLEWIPSSYATCISGGGIHTTTSCETNLASLFAAGDITCIPPHGTYSIGGINLAFCTVSGRQAAESAASAVSGRPDEDGLSLEKLCADYINPVLSFLDGPRSVSVDGFVKGIQGLIIPTEAGYLKTPAKLAECMEEADRLEREDLPRLGAVDSHGLLRVLECRSMVTLAKLMIKASLLRTESRGFHFRQDYPMTDNVNWLKWLLLSRKGDKAGADDITFSTVDVPTPYMRPEADYSVPPGVRRI
jgi:succinate dehydrogenase/fumarate reductase flavoprotein subunit